VFLFFLAYPFFPFSRSVVSQFNFISRALCTLFFSLEPLSVFLLLARAPRIDPLFI